MDRFPEISPCKRGADICVLLRNMEILRQIALDRKILQRLSFHLHTPGEDRRKKRLLVRRDQNDDRVGRRLLDRL